MRLTVVCCCSWRCLQILEVMCDEEIALCLTPQSFHNISADADLFNNINKQFWECW